MNSTYEFAASVGNQRLRFVKSYVANARCGAPLTEGSTDYNDPHYKDDWSKWSSTYTDVLSNGCRSAVAWNVATDEHGKPNIGPYPCGGIVIINAHTQEVIRSGQFGHRPG
jgi:hypothetical protein